MMMSPDSAVRASRILNSLTDARKLDQSLNLDKPEGDQQQKGFLLLGGDNDLIKKRREHEKR